MTGIEPQQRGAIVGLCCSVPSWGCLCSQALLPLSSHFQVLNSKKMKSVSLCLLCAFSLFLPILCIQFFNHLHCLFEIKQDSFLTMGSNMCSTFYCCFFLDSLRQQHCSLWSLHLRCVLITAFVLNQF